MKTIVIGDIHGRDVWKQILKLEQVLENKDTQVIFLGDYFDSFDIDISYQIENFRAISKLKKDYPDKVILLLGNHDVNYLDKSKYPFANCSGWSRDTYEQVHKELTELYESKQVIFSYLDADNKILFTHAGQTKTWLSERLNEDSNIADKYGFTDMGSGDPYGNDPHQSPIWVRPSSLLEDNGFEFTQVVGHTRQSNGIRKVDNVWFCDCLDYVNQYLVIKEGVFRVEEVG